jgi:hypothetical protein
MEYNNRYWKNMTILGVSDDVRIINGWPFKGWPSNTARVSNLKRDFRSLVEIYPFESNDEE